MAERTSALSGRLHNMNLNEERKTHMKKLACLLLALVMLLSLAACAPASEQVAMISILLERL